MVGQNEKHICANAEAETSERFRPGELLPGVMRGWFVLPLLLAAVTPALANLGPYDAAADFSIASNPNGVWSYLVNGAPLSFTMNPCSIPGTVCWWNGGTTYPNASFITENQSNQPVQTNNTVEIPAGAFDMDPEGNSLTMDWTAPAAGTWYVSGFFFGMDSVSMPHPAEVTLDSSTTLFATTINGFGNVTNFSFALALNAGDVIGFEVDHGLNNGAFLSTGFDAAIATTPITVPPVTPLEPGCCNGGPGGGGGGSGSGGSGGGGGSPVPEPGFYGLLAVLLFGLTVIGRHRRRQRT
jgi:hypothetical protein